MFSKVQTFLGSTKGGVIISVGKWVRNNFISSGPSCTAFACFCPPSCQSPFKISLQGTKVTPKQIEPLEELTTWKLGGTHHLAYPWTIQTGFLPLDIFSRCSRRTDASAHKDLDDFRHRSNSHGWPTIFQGHF